MRNPEDPIQALRDANPHPTQELPPDVSARLWARIQEDTMLTPTPKDRPSIARRWMPAVIGAPVLAITIALALVLSGGSSDGDPSVAIGNGTATCIEVYTPENLLHRAFAFDGTVTSIEQRGEEFGVLVTFDVNTAYRGDVRDGITLQAVGVGGDSEGGPTIAIGDRLLVSGDEDYMWTCGFSRTWSPEMAAEWEAATR